MTDNNFSCIPALGAIPSIKTSFLQRHAKSVMKGCLAADNWINNHQQSHFFVEVSAHAKQQKLLESQPFRVGYWLRLEQYLRDYLLQTTPAQHLVEKFQQAMNEHIDALSSGFIVDIANIKGRCFGRLQQAFELGLITGEEAEKWGYKVLGAIEVGEFNAAKLKKREKQEKIKGRSL